MGKKKRNLGEFLSNLCQGLTAPPIPGPGIWLTSKCKLIACFVVIGMCPTLLMVHTANLVMDASPSPYTPKADKKNLFQKRSVLRFEILKLAQYSGVTTNFFSAR